MLLVNNYALYLYKGGYLLQVVGGELLKKIRGKKQVISEAEIKDYDFFWRGGGEGG